MKLNKNRKFKNCFITGITGSGGSYLAEHIYKKDKTEDNRIVLLGNWKIIHNFGSICEFIKRFHSSKKTKIYVVGNITQKQIAKAWRKRWLNKRILNENIKKTMMNADPKSHTLKQKIEQLRND